MISRATVFRDIAALGIKPLGFPKQRPQQWPAETARRIMERRGIIATTTGLEKVKASAKTALATLAQLRSERRKAKQSPRR